MKGSQQIDWVFNKKLGRQRKVIQTHPLRAGLEVAQYGREYLCSDYMGSEEFSNSSLAALDDSTASSTMSELPSPVRFPP